MTLREITFKFKSSDGQIEKQYTIREMNGEEDLAFEYQYTNPQTKAVDTRSLWIKRLSRCLVNPKLTEVEISQLPLWELQGLMIKWMEMNNPDMKSFLEISSPTVPTH